MICSKLPTEKKINEAKPFCPHRMLVPLSISIYEVLILFFFHFNQNGFLSMSIEPITKGFIFRSKNVKDCISIFYRIHACLA